MAKVRIKIRETKDRKDWKIIRKMAIASGAEPGFLKNVVTAWIAEHDNEIVGGLLLEKFDDQSAIDYLVVLEKYRLQGIARKLIETTVIEAKKMGFHIMLASTRIPDFWKKFGFNEMSMVDVPKDYSCVDCRRYLKDCFPAALKLNLI